MPSDIMIILLIILGVVIYIRGPKVLPKFGAALGRGVKEARNAAASALDRSDDEEDAATKQDATTKQA